METFFAILMGLVFTALAFGIVALILVAVADAIAGLGNGKLKSFFRWRK